MFPAATPPAGTVTATVVPDDVLFPVARSVTPSAKVITAVDADTAVPTWVPPSVAVTVPTPASVGAVTVAV